MDKVETRKVSRLSKDQNSFYSDSRQWPEEGQVRIKTKTWKGLSLIQAQKGSSLNVWTLSWFKL